VWGSGGIAPPFLTSAVDGGEWSASRPGRFIARGRSPRYPLDRRLGGPQGQSGRCGEEKNLAVPGIEPGPSSPSLYRRTDSDEHGDRGAALHANDWTSKFRFARAGRLRNAVAIATVRFAFATCA
jgi:hypothetical protein